MTCQEHGANQRWLKRSEVTARTGLGLGELCDLEQRGIIVIHRRNARNWRIPEADIEGLRERIAAQERSAVPAAADDFLRSIYGCVPGEGRA